MIAARMSREKWLWLELGAIAALCFLPQLWASAGSFLPGRSALPNSPLWALEVGLISVYLSRLAASLFIVWGAGEGLAKFGLRRFRAPQGISYALCGVLLFIVLISAMTLLYLPQLTSFQQQTSHYGRAPRLHLDPIAAPLVLAARALRGTLEEFTLRGYLLTRLPELTGESPIPVAASCTLFALIHIGEGVEVIPLYVLLGLFLARSFRATRSIWPGAIALTIVFWLQYVLAHYR